MRRVCDSNSGRTQAITVRTNEIAKAVARLIYQAQRFANEHGGIRALPFGIARWEVSSDIAGGNRAQQRVGQRVQQNIAIGVAGQSAMMRQREAPNLERHAGLE